MDIIFHRSDMNEKHIHFPLYYISPIFYLEHFLSKSNNKCITIPITNTNTQINDQIKIIFSYAFSGSNTATNYICNYDSYLIYIGGLIGVMFILFILILFIPGANGRGWEIIGKLLYNILKIFYDYLLHILFYLCTKKFIFHTKLIGDGLSVFTVIWIVLTLILFVCSFMFNKYSHHGHCMLNYIIEDNTSEVFLSFLSSLIINLRHTQTKFFFFHFFWYLVFIKQCYNLFWQFRYKVFSRFNEKVNFYIKYFFLSYSTSRLVISIVLCIAGYSLQENQKIAFHVLEFVLGIIMYCLVIILLHIYLVKELKINDLIYSLKNDNEMGQFEELFIVFMLKFTDYFQFRLFRVADLRDRELILEMQRRRKEIVDSFKNQFLFLIKKEKMFGTELKDESDNKFESSEGTPEHKNNIVISSVDNNHLVITEEMMLINKFNEDIKKLPLKKGTTHKTMQKFESINNKEKLSEENEFKQIQKIILKLAKMIKKHINTNYWNVNTKKQIFEFLVFVKLICYCEYDENTNRAEFYVKKYLRRKAVSSKFEILLRFLDIKFRMFSLSLDDNAIHTIKMIELSNKLLDLIKMFKLILEQFELNGDTEQKKLEIIEKDNEAIGKCYAEVSHYSQLTDNQFKQNENATYVKLKIAQQLLFSPELPDKLIEETDIQVTELEFNKSNYFILSFEKDTIAINRSPAKYLEKSGFKGEDLFKKEITTIIPKCFKRFSYMQLKSDITKKGKSQFENTEFLLTKDNYILRAKLKYTTLPIISTEALIFAEVDFNLKNFNTCFIINSKNEIIEIGNGLRNFFGLTPSMLPLSLSDVFDTSQPIQYKFLHNRHYHTLNLQHNKAITLNIEGYLKIYQQLRKLHGIQTEDKNFVDNIKKFLDMHKIKDKSTISILFSKVDYLSKRIDNIYDVYSFMFPTTTGGSTILEGSFSTKVGGGSSNGMSTMGGGIMEPLGMAFENKYTYCSSSSVSMSTTSLNKVNAVLNGQRGRSTKNKRNINIPEILETTYGIILIIVVIILVILIKILSDDLVMNFSILKNIRLLTSYYYNGSFHLINKIIFRDNTNYNSVELDIIDKIPGTKPFCPYYQLEFELISENFFTQYNEFISEIHKHLKAEFINEKINLLVDVIQNDGTNITENFIEAMNIPKLNFYFLSRNKEYMETLPFFDITNDYGNELYKLNEIQQTFYVTLLNYQNILDKFLDVSENIRLMFSEKFGSYRVRIYVIFCCSIFINLLLFFLYAFNTNSTKNKLLRVSETFFIITKKNISYLNQKLDHIRKIIDVEEHPNQVLTKITKSIQKKRLSEKTNKTFPIGNETNKQGTSPSSLSIENKKQPTHHEIKTTNVKYMHNNKKDTHYLKIYCSVLTAIIITHSLFLIYAVIVIPLLSMMMENILVIQQFTREATNLQRVAINYYLTLEIFILFNKTEDAINSGYVDDYPSTFYESLKTIQNYMTINDDLKPIEEYLNSLYGDELCANAFINNPDDNMIKMCFGIDIQHSSWTNVLSHVIRTIRNLFYNFDNSNRTLSDIDYYFHCEEMQEINIISFTLVQEMIDYIKDINGMIIYEKAINHFVINVILMSVSLILLEVSNFIIITMKIVKKLKNTFSNFQLIEKFFLS